MKIAKLFFFSILNLTFFLAGASAYTRMGQNVHWQSSPQYYINLQGAPGITNGSDFWAIQKSFETWRLITTAQILIGYQGTTDVQVAGDDGINLISFADEETPFSSGTIAMTLMTWDNSGFMQDADIVFNPSLKFSTSGAPDAFDIQSVATHEIGHFLGLDHTAIVSATLNPFGRNGSTFQRLLRSDDLIGISVIYPAAGFLASRGSISGNVKLSNVLVFGAHVVALDQNGNSVASAVTDSSGVYEISGLSPGTYSLYAEPLDGPATEDNFISGSGLGAFNTNFGTTFYGDTQAGTNARMVSVSAGTNRAGININVIAAPSDPLNILWPDLGVLTYPGFAGSIEVIGLGFSGGMKFTSKDPSLFWGPASLDSSVDASATLSIGTGAALGEKSLFLGRTGALSALSGGIIVADPAPVISDVSPASGPAEGGTRIHVTGASFRDGMFVSLGGIPLQDVTLLSSTAFEATTPDNSGEPANLLVINPQGISAVKESAFTYLWPPLTIKSVSPLSGVPGTLVTILGSNFHDRAINNQVFFNSIPAPIMASSPGQLLVRVPYNATSGPITVATFGQSITGPVFAVTIPPPSTNSAPGVFSYVDTSESANGAKLPFSASTRDSNDEVVTWMLPFDFTLFTTFFPGGSKISVTNNGWLSLKSSIGTVAEWENMGLPAATVTRADGSPGSIPGNLIAPFFDDLTQDLTGGGVFARTVGSAPNQQFVVEWKGSRRINANGDPIDGNLTFQAILYEGSNDIVFQYQSLQGQSSLGESATVGLQNAQRNSAAQYCFNQSKLYEGAAIVFRFNPMTGSYLVSDNRARQFIPFVTDTLAFRTNLGITNSSSQNAQVTITLYDESGIPFGSRTDTIQALGLKQYNNVVRSLIGTDETAITNQSGAILIDSDRAVTAYATQIDNKSSDPSLFVAKKAGLTDCLIPSTTSVNQFRSSVVIQNTADSPATVTLRQHDQTGTVRAEQKVTISPKGYYASENLHDALELSGVYGPLEIHSLNRAPLVVTSRVYALGSGISGFFEGMDLSRSLQQGILPLTLDNVSFRTNAGIDNLSDSEATVEVKFINQAGTVLGIQTVKVPAHGLFQQNVFKLFGSSNFFADVPGYLMVSSDQPIAGFTSLIDNTGDDPSLSQLISSGETHLLIPSSTNVGSFRSNLILVNLSPTQPAPIKISVRDPNGTLLGEDATQIIPANGFYLVEDLLTSLKIASNYGPLEIQSLNQIPLAAVSRVYSLSQHTSGFFQAVPY